MTLFELQKMKRGDKYLIHFGGGPLRVKVLRVDSRVAKWRALGLSGLLRIAVEEEYRETFEGRILAKI